MIDAMIWPIMATFLDYLDNVVDATIELDGAERVEAGFRFPSVSGGHLTFSGSVRISAHGGALGMEVIAPVIHVRGADMLLHITTHSGPLDLARILDRPMDDARLMRDGGQLSDVALTVDGAELFGGVYPPWKRMAPILLR